MYTLKIIGPKQCALLKKEMRLRHLIDLLSVSPQLSEKHLLPNFTCSVPEGDTPPTELGGPHGSLWPLSPVAGKGKEAESQEERNKSPDVIPKSICLKRESMRPDLRPNMRPGMRCNMNPT